MAPGSAWSRIPVSSRSYNSSFYFSDPVPLFLVYTAFYFSDPVPSFSWYRITSVMSNACAGSVQATFC